MKALVYEGPNIINVKDVPDVSPAKGEVKLKIMACGICGSDVHGYLGLTGRRYPPMTMGHEFVGQVAELGEGVTTLKVGDRVCPYPVDFCGECDVCKKGDTHLCAQKKQYGCLGFDGAFAEYLCLPAKLCFPLKDTTSFDVASLMEPLSVSYRGVSHAGDLTGKTVLIVGAGTIGLLALAVVRSKNPGRILVSDLSDFRLGVAKEMGADVVINPKTDNFDEVIAANTNGKGVDVSFEAVGAGPTVQMAVAATRFAGTSIWIGNNKPMIEINMQHIVTHELTVLGSFLYSFEDFRTAVNLVNDGKVKVDSLITNIGTLAEAPDYFYKLAHEPGNMLKVVIHPND